ncbi:MAG: signal peptide peptidase SppA [Bacteroidales bacterium]|nr:signal peptide peptidase SppA [Bacteroidales bacterium]
MKDFLKMVLAVLCGLLLMGVLSIFLFSGFIASLSLAGGAQPVLPKTGVLGIDMSKIAITEQTQPQDPFASMQKQGVKTVSLMQAVQAIRIAAQDPGVKFIFLRTDGGSTGIAALEELRKALEQFRGSGKAVISYLESPTTAGYYLASVSDKIYMTPHDGANILFTGISGQGIFLKDLLDRLGVNVQLIRHGKYKSAGEMYIRNASSPENREQNEVLVQSIWKTIAAPIAESRGISVAALDKAIDNLELCLPEDFLSHSLVDGLLTREELKERIATLAVEESFNKVSFIPFADYAQAKCVPNYRARKKIAVIFADGEIVDGREPRNVAGDRFAKVVSEVRADSTVKAVVLRVNSPGGSVLASEKIRSELDLLAGVKPLIASYGGYAASGGYWISSGCRKIYTDATTLTGSIGVFGMIPDFGRTAKDKLHVGIEFYKTHKHADMYGLMRPLDGAETAYIQRSIENIYDRFLSIVSEGRGMEKTAVDAIAQGRVWSGADALGIGLADEIGTLDDALHYAAVCADDATLGNWEVAEYPRPLTAMEQFQAMLNPADDGEMVLVRELRNLREPRILARMPLNFELRY